MKRVRVQPNPASDFLQIENRLFSDLSFKILDAAGSLKMANGTVLGNSVARLDIEFLPAGLYLLIGCDVGGKPLYFKKFVKQ
ncbi:MAG: T9SS type A sorting domain-containing protein [Saprospiraceae bacterium]|nr:T9SS type A sorting domain-containing protein [Saprospiraceae bacterium]